MLGQNQKMFSRGSSSGTSLATRSALPLLSCALGSVAPWLRVFDPAMVLYSRIIHRNHNGLLSSQSVGTVVVERGSVAEPELSGWGGNGIDQEVSRVRERGR